MEEVKEYIKMVYDPSYVSSTILPFYPNADLAIRQLGEKKGYDAVIIHPQHLFHSRMEVVHDYKTGAMVDISHPILPTRLDSPLLLAFAVIPPDHNGGIVGIYDYMEESEIKIITQGEHIVPLLQQNECTTIGDTCSLIAHSWVLPKAVISGISHQHSVRLAKGEDIGKYVVKTVGGIDILDPPSQPHKSLNIDLLTVDGVDKISEVIMDLSSRKKVLYPLIEIESYTYGDHALGRLFRI